MSLKKAYQDMIKVQGVVDTATLMEMTESSIDNRVYERQGQSFTVRQSMRLQQVSGTTRFAEEIAKLSGGTFVKIPGADDIDNDNLHHKFHELYSELGRLSQTYSEATQDGEIDKREKAELTAISDAMHRTMQELMGLMFRIYCRDEKKD